MKAAASGLFYDKNTNFFPYLFVDCKFFSIYYKYKEGISMSEAEKQKRIAVGENFLLFQILNGNLKAAVAMSKALNELDALEQDLEAGL